MLLLTDAPCHGYLPSSFSPTADRWIRHPLGLTAESVAGDLINKDVDMFMCSLNPTATMPFEDALSDVYSSHRSNTEERKIVSIPLVPVDQSPGTSDAGGPPIGTSKHIVFVLDESGSMQYEWSGVVKAYSDYMNRRLDQQFDSDLVSVVQFDDTARATVNQIKLSSAPHSLCYRGGGTRFAPAAATAEDLTTKTPASHVPVVVFMSDGMADDAEFAANIFKSINQEVIKRYREDLELHVIGFGGGTDTAQLRSIANASRRGSLHTTSDVAGLSNVFVQIAGGGDVATVLESEIIERIYDAVSDRLTAEYAG
jgi:uncharacterized protein YegL